MAVLDRSMFHSVWRLWISVTPGKRTDPAAPLLFADMTLNHLFTLSWLGKNKRLSSLLLMVTSAWPHNQMLVALLWSPLLLTRIASCPRNAADVQQCIVVPGCSSAPIPFKAHPSGWHQLGCCRKCTIYITPSFWEWILGMDLNWSLQKLSSTHPPWTPGRETHTQRKKNCYTYHFAKLKPNSSVSLEVSLCVASRLCSAFISRLSILPHAPSPATSHLRKTKRNPMLITKQKHLGRDSFWLNTFQGTGAVEGVCVTKSAQPPQVDTDGKNGRRELQTGSVGGVNTGCRHMWGREFVCVGAGARERSHC